MTTKKTESLSADEITTAHTSRRSAMLMIGGVIVTALGAQACNTGCTDSDTGTFRDPAGSGTRCRTGCSDTDSGSGADPAGNGRRC